MVNMLEKVVIRSRNCDFLQALCALMVIKSFLLWNYIQILIKLIKGRMNLMYFSHYEGMAGCAQWKPVHFCPLFFEVLK